MSAVKPPVGWSALWRVVRVVISSLTVRIRARFEQQIDDVGMAFRGGPHQRRGLLKGLGGVHVGAAREQQAHGRDAPCARRAEQRRLTLRVRALWIGARPQEQIDHRRVAVSARLEQRRHAEVVRRIDGSLGGNERAGDLDVGVMSGP